MTGEQNNTNYLNTIGMRVILDSKDDMAMLRFLHDECLFLIVNGDSIFRDRN